MNNTTNTPTKFTQKLRAMFSIKNIIGIVLGLVGGFIYYRTIGCSSGACPITSNPWLTITWGGLAGYLLADMIPLKKKKEAPGEPEVQ